MQEVRQHKKRTAKHMDEPNIFSGLVFCADCGKPMVLHRATTMKKLEYNFKCYTYGKKGKTACSAHHIRECDLTQIVLDDLRRVTHFARMKERQFAAHINQKNSAELRQEMNRVLRELDAMKKRSAELSKLFKRLYEDNVLGRVTDEQYRMLSGDYTDEQRMLEEQIPQKEQRLAQLQAREANVDAFIEKAKQYTAIDTLTRNCCGCSFSASRSVNGKQNTPAIPASLSASFTGTSAQWTAPCSRTRSSRSCSRR